MVVFGDGHFHYTIYIIVNWYTENKYGYKGYVPLLHVGWSKSISLKLEGFWHTKETASGGRKKCETANLDVFEVSGNSMEKFPRWSPAVSPTTWIYKRTVNNNLVIFWVGPGAWCMYSTLNYHYTLSQNTVKMSLWFTKHFRYLKWRVHPHLYKLYGWTRLMDTGKPTPHHQK